MMRPIHGPDKEHLTGAECAEWLGVSVSTFKTLVAAGEFPPALRIGRGSARWPWLDVIAYGWMRARLAEADAGKRR